jgi:hypothetical protein
LLLVSFVDHAITVVHIPPSYLKIL